MGFFDVFRSRNKPPAAPRQATPADSKATPQSPASSTNTVDRRKRLEEIRELLAQKKHEAAIRTVELLLAAAPDDGTVLAEVSNELGKNGMIEKLIELIAPRYSVEKHGPGAGMNLLQAYLVMANSERAAEMLARLDALKDDAIASRLGQLRELLSDLREAEKSSAAQQQTAPGGAPIARISLVSISKPIWFYGIEPMAEKILPPKAMGKTRHVAFAQLALPGMDPQVLSQLMNSPEEELGRLTRSLPLWLAETLNFSPNYTSIAALGILEDKQNGSAYALFGADWTNDHLQQLIETAGESIDFIFTGSIVRKDLDTEITLRLWDAKKVKERKQFTAIWSPSTMDAELARLHETVRTYMECLTYPQGQGLPYVSPAVPSAWLDTLGASVSLFLVEKGAIPPFRLRSVIEDVDKAAARAAAGNSASIAYITLRKRAEKIGVKVPSETPVLASHPLVSEALSLSMK